MAIPASARRARAADDRRTARRRGTADERPHRRPRLSLELAIGLALAGAVCLLYAPVVGYDFINFDDRDYVTQNPHVRGGLSLAAVRWALTGVHAANWFPLTWLSHMLDYQLFGLNAGGHHVVSVLLHAASSVLLFVAFRLMTGAVWRSAFLAALFAVHPLRVESVAWISERKDVLCMLFWTIGLCCYWAYARRPSLSRHLVLLLVFGLGLLSKGTIMTIALAWLLLDWWPLGRVALSGAPAAPVPDGPSAVPPWRLLVEKIPLFVLVMVAAVVTFLVQQRYGAGTVLENHPLALRVPTMLVSYVRYLEKTIWPVRLAIFYPLEGPPSPARLIVAIGVLAAISILALRNARRRPYLIVGWLWYLGTLFPMLDLVKLGGREIADRYSYVPSIGLLLMATWGAADVCARSRVRPPVAALVALVVLSAAALTTRAQLRHWRNSATLFEHALAVTADNHLAHYNLGVDLAERGRVDEAIVHYEEAIRIKPDYALAHANLGTLLAARGEVDRAIPEYLAALRAWPTFAEAHNNLAIALERTGRPHEALEQYAEAVRLRPERPDGHFNLAAALGGEGRTEDAIAQLREALRLQPDFADAGLALGTALVQQGRTAEAAQAYRDLLRVRPDHAGVRERLAWLLATSDDPSVRDPAAAVSLAEAVCRATDRKDPEYLRTLAVAYAAAGRLADARRTAEEALALARSSGRTELAAELADRVATYRAAAPPEEGR